MRLTAVDRFSDTQQLIRKLDQLGRTAGTAPAVPQRGPGRTTPPRRGHLTARHPRCRRKKKTLRDPELPADARRRSGARNGDPGVPSHSVGRPFLRQFKDRGKGFLEGYLRRARPRGSGW